MHDADSLFGMFGAAGGGSACVCARVPRACMFDSMAAVACQVRMPS